jgi:hypothetical protein
MGKPALDLSKLTADEKLDLVDDLWRSLSSDDLPPSSALSLTAALIASSSKAPSVSPGTTSVPR